MGLQNNHVFGALFSFFGTLLEPFGEVFWRLLGFLGRSWAAQWPPNFFGGVFFQFFGLIWPLLARLWAFFTSLGRIFGHLGPSKTHFGASGDRFCSFHGPILELQGQILELPGNSLGAPIILQIIRALSCKHTYQPKFTKAQRHQDTEPSSLRASSGLGGMREA